MVDSTTPAGGWAAATNAGRPQPTARLQDSLRRRAGPAARLVLADEGAVQPEQDHHADDRADEAAEVEHVVVADAEQLREDEEADDGSGEAEQDGGEEAHGVLAG